MQVNLPVLISNIQNILKVSCSSSSMALGLDGFLYTWGESTQGDSLYPQSITSLIPNKVIDFSLNRAMSAVIDSTGMVWVWGENKRGELGVRDQCSRDNPYPLASLKGKPVETIAVGHNFTIALG